MNNLVANEGDDVLGLFKFPLIKKIKFWLTRSKDGNLANYQIKFNLI